MSEKIGKEKIIQLLEESFGQHISFLDALLASPRKEIVQAALEVLQLIRKDGFDSQAIKLITVHEHFDEVLAIATLRPRKAYAPYLMKHWDDFPVRSQLKLMPALAKLGDPFEVSSFLVEKWNGMDPSIRVEAMATLLLTGDRETLDFVLQRMAAFPAEDELQVQGRFLRLGKEFDQRATTWFVEQFRTKEALDIRAGYLRLLALGEPDVGVQILIESLQRQPEIIVSAAFDALIHMNLQEQIPENLLELYSSSRFYRLAVNVARIYGIKFQKSQDRDALSRGMNIISWLLNDNTREARMAAIEGSRWFPGELRVVDWVGSLLLSTDDEEILEQAIAFLQDTPPTDALKQMLLKAFARGIPMLEQHSLRLLQRHADPDMSTMLLETVAKNRLTAPQVAAQAVSTLARCIVVAREGEYFPLLKEEAPEILHAALEGMVHWRSENSRRVLEKEYQNYSGTSRAIAADVLFQKGVSYIPDDIHALLASDHPTEQRIGLVGLKRMLLHVRETPADALSADLISNIELWHVEAMRRRLEASVLEGFEPRRVLPLRLLLLQEKYEEALQYIERKQEEIEEPCWYMNLGYQIVNEKLGRETEAEPLLQLIEKAPHHVSGHEFILNFYRRLRRRSEFVHHQLQLLEIKHNCYGQLLHGLNEMPKEEYESSFCLNLMKLIQSASLPSDISLHQVLSQAFLKLRQPELAYEHLVYGVFNIAQNQWYVDTVTCALKTGRPAIARQILKLAPKLGLPPATLSKLKTLQEKMDAAKGIA